MALQDVLLPGLGFYSIRTWRHFGFIPVARLSRGSVVLRHFFGITQSHAQARAERWYYLDC